MRSRSFSKSNLLAGRLNVDALVLIVGVYRLVLLVCLDYIERDS